MMDITQIAVAAGVQGIVGLLFYFAVNRQVEKVDRLEKKVDDLSTNRITKIEEDLKDACEKSEKGFAHAAQARKGIYQELEWQKTHFVHVKTCTDAHKTLSDAINRFLAVTNDLARHDEKIATLADGVRDMRELWLGMKTDIDKHLGGTQR
jgi:hypothetical protein